MQRHISYKIHLAALSALTIAATTACSSSDEPQLVDGSAIEFAIPEVSVGEAEVVSRGQMLQSFPENELFGVIGYCVPFTLLGSDAANESHLDYSGAESDWIVKKSTIHPGLRVSGGNAELLMQPILYDGTKCVYSDGTTSGYTHPAHWYETATSGNPDAFSYTFIAYHPWTTDRGQFELIGSTPLYNTKGAPRLKYTTPYNKDNDTNHDTSLERDPDKAKDAMVAVTYNRVRAAGAIPFKFDHIQSAIRIQLNNLNGNKDLKVTDLSISGSFYHSATWDFSDADPKITVDRNEIFSGTFPFVKPATPLSIPKNTAIVPGTDADHEFGTTILLLPDLDNPDDKQYLGFNKTIHITYAFDGDADRTADISLTLGRKPEMGKLYTLNLNFIGDQIILMFTADATEYWEPGSDNDIIIN